MRTIYVKDAYIKGDIKELIDPPVVIRVGEITEAAAVKFSEEMTRAYNTGQGVVPVVIDSYGGDAYALLSMLSDVESCRLPVATICVGKAMSAAAILLAHGTPKLRFIDHNATVMIHQVSSFNWGKLADLKNDVAETERLNGILFCKMAEACGYKNLNFFLDMIQKKGNMDIYLNSLEAKKLKVADHIGIPEFQVEVASNIDFAFRPVELKKRKIKKKK